jgi:hypothetical protein
MDHVDSTRSQMFSYDSVNRISVGGTVKVTTAYKIDTANSGPGGRWFKSTRIKFAGKVRLAKS